MATQPVSPHPRGRRQGGFTLLEVLVAVTIMSMVMTGLYMSVDATMRTQDLLDHEIEVVKQGPRILALIERDLRQAYLLDIDENGVFRGESRTMLGESADRLTLISTVDTTFTHPVGDREVPADLAETGYRLRIHPEIPDLLQLWRRQGFFIDEKPYEDGSYELIYDRVRSFQLRYFEDWTDDAEELREWDSAQRQALPVAVELRLEIEVGERGANQTREEASSRLRTLSYERLIPLAVHSELTLRAHALTPIFADAAASGEGEGGGGGGGDGEEGPEGFPGGGAGGPPEGLPGGGGGGSGAGAGGGDGDEIVIEVDPDADPADNTGNPFDDLFGDGSGDGDDVDLDDLFGGAFGGG